VANGDIAASLGWPTYSATQDRKLGYDNDNAALDRAAQNYITLRDEVLPAIDQPVFLARGVSTTAVGSGDWVNITRWEVGQLTVQKDGVYRADIHAQFGFDLGENTDMTYIGAQLVKNTTAPNTPAGTVLKNVPGRGSAAVDLRGLVPLVAGDVVTLLVRQNNGRGARLNLGTAPFDVTMSLEWIRA
jgi:hypothetical protein